MYDLQILWPEFDTRATPERSNSNEHGPQLTVDYAPTVPSNERSGGDLLESFSSVMQVGSRHFLLTATWFRSTFCRPWPPANDTPGRLIQGSAKSCMRVWRLNQWRLARVSIVIA